MAYIRREHIRPDTIFNPANVGICVTEVFPGATAGATAGATTASYSILGATDASAGTVAFTAGDMDAETTDVPRNVRLYVVGGSLTDVDTGTAILTYYRPNGDGPRTMSITGIGYTAGTTGNKLVGDFPDGVSRVAGLLVSGATGADLTGLMVGLAPGPKLAVANVGAPGANIVHEADGTGVEVGSLPSDFDYETGLFTPVTTLDGATDVTVRVNLGGARP